MDIFNSITSFLALIGLGLVFWQLRESIKDRHVEITMKFIDSLGSEENRVLRKFIYNDLPQNITDFTNEQILKVEKVCNSFEQAALFGNRKFVDKDLLLSMYCVAIGWCWEILYPWIENERKHLSNLHMIEFQQLAKDAQEYWRKHQPGEAFPPLPSQQDHKTE